MCEMTNIINERNAIIQKIDLPDITNNIQVYMKRDDLLHPEISGNKWRKLKYNLCYAKEQGYDKIITFGGAFSNHIYAAASAGKVFGFKTIGIIRGEEHLPLNPTLSFAVQCGMELHYLDRTTYRQRNDKDFQKSLTAKYGDAYIVPEGGSNMLALKGVEEIIKSIDIDYDYICCANGTGGTIAGLIAGLKGNKKVLGFPSLKGAEFLYDVINQFVDMYTGTIYDNYKLMLDYNFGGYAKINYELTSFMEKFYSLNNIELDPVYTGKMMFGINDLIKNKYFPDDTKIIAVHTGGLQGNAGMKTKIEKIKMSVNY